MDKDQVTKVMVMKSKAGLAWRLAIVVAVVLVVAGVIGVVAAGFRGRNIEENAEAMTTPAAAPGKSVWRPWWLQ